jgi:threonine dehydratase
LSVELEDHPGSLAKLLTVVSELGANIVQVQHDRSFAPADVAKVKVTLVLETTDQQHVSSIHAELIRRGWSGSPD